MQHRPGGHGAGGHQATPRKDSAPPATRFNTPAAVPRTLRLPEHTVTVIPDGRVQLHPQRWLTGPTAADWTDERRPYLLDDEGFIAGSVAALLVESRGRALLIDAGFGPQSIHADHTIPPIGALSGGWLTASLEKAGRDPATVETIAFTHLHDDHVGWALGGGPGRPTPFTAATLVASREEWADWSRPAPALRTAVAEAGQEIFPGVTALPTPGHTVGHTSYVISSGGSRLIALGDVFHTPAQLAHPQWTVVVDALPQQAVASRRHVLAQLSEPGTLAYANHFADVHFGRLVRDGEGDAWWQPVEDAD